MYMEDWIKEVENLLKIRHYDILNDKGKISKKEAEEKALSEYEKFKVIQDKTYISDFDKLLLETEQIQENGNN